MTRKPMFLLSVILVVSTRWSAAAQETRTNAPPPGLQPVADGVIQITDTGWTTGTSSSDCVTGAADDSWQLTLTQRRQLTVTATDCCCPGDYFEVFVNGEKIGTTPNLAPPWGCDFSGPLSSGSFNKVLSPGVHTITVRDAGFDGHSQSEIADQSMCPAGFTVSGSLGPPPSIEITLMPSPPENRYVIDASPQMPTIQAKAKVVGVTPDPTPMTTFTWSASLKVHENVPSRDVDFAPDIVQNTTTTGEALYTLQFTNASMFRGGQLKLKAEATVDGDPLTGETPDGLRIEGTNPQRSALQGYLDGQNVAVGHGLNAGEVRDALKKIACQESQQREFRATANGGIGPALISFDDGVGIFQITNAPCDPFATCRDAMFNWQENVNKGIDAFREKVGIAVSYPRNLRRSQAYQNFITNTINPQRMMAGRRPINGTPAPSFTTNGLLGANPPNQLLEDAVRGYNGFAGTLFGLNLHEFAPDTNFLLNATDQQLHGINNDPAVWRRVPAAERPQQIGDPAYVGNVTARAATCGG